MLAKAGPSGDLIATPSVLLVHGVIEAELNRGCSALHQFNKHVPWNEWLYIRIAVKAFKQILMVSSRET